MKLRKVKAMLAKTDREVAVAQRILVDKLVAARAAVDFAINEIQHRQVKQLVEGRTKNRWSLAVDDPVIEDGFGGAWSKRCGTCRQLTMQVLRPGKVQCAKCG